MRCADALEAMLTCDPEVLTGEGDHPVAEHLRSCRRCSAVGCKLVGGVALLGVADQPPVGLAVRRRARRRVGAALIGLAAAAAVVFAVVRGRAVGAGEVATRSTSAAVPTVMPAPTLSLRADRTTPPVRKRRPTTERRPVDVVVADPTPLPLTGQPSDDALPAMPPSDSLSSVSTGPATVRVVLRKGQSAAIITTFDPKVTIVWLYGDRP